MAIADNVPLDIDIVPVYLKVEKKDKEILYKICECESFDPRSKTGIIGNITKYKSSCYRLDL